MGTEYHMTRSHAAGPGTPGTVRPGKEVIQSMTKRLKLLWSIVISALACAPALGGPTNVLVVMNGNSADSITVSKYYASKRGIDRKYICKIYCPSDEFVTDEVFEETIRGPIKTYLMETGLKGQIDYLVTTKGIPFRTKGRWSVDSVLTCPFHDYRSQQQNPYFGAKKRFSHKQYQMYLVTRLDGLTVADAKALVDRSLAAKREKGLFLFDVSPGKDRNSSYKFLNEAMRRAAEMLKSKGFKVEIQEAPGFAVRTGLMGYFGWGANDDAYSQKGFEKLRFRPGSIADMAYSASAVTLTGKIPAGTQRSFITVPVTNGVTGIKGYVQEPYVYAVALPDILFDRYTSGYNLAESFYAASRFIHWRDMVLGDPLCAPYAK